MRDAQSISISAHSRQLGTVERVSKHFESLVHYWKSLKHRFGECSRSCGGGVQLASRNCDNPPPTNGGKYCVGQKIQYRSCNIQDCPDDALDFRAEQCSRFDKINFNANWNNTKWLPKYGLDSKDECKLYCRLENRPDYFELANRVIDGTPCAYHNFNKCINGACVPAGCDNELYSTAELDMCGVCKGRNETCESYHGNLTHHQFRKQANYQNNYFIFPVVTIPKGATNVEIVQHYDGQNYIALRDDHDEYILNKLHHIDVVNRTIYYGGITLEYNRDGSFERINSAYARKLKRELKVDILSYSTPAPVDDYIIKFSYTRSDAEKVVLSNHITNNYQNNYNEHPSMKKHYVWQMQDWSNCSSLCQGKQIRKASCIEQSSKVVVSDSYCRNTAKPFDDYKECNTDCRLGWEAFKSECSVTCGDGNRTIKYECVQRYDRHSEYSKIVDRSNCPQRQEITRYEPCSQHCNEVLWIYSDWSPVRIYFHLR